MERIFNLDPQLIQDAIILLVNVFLLFLVASYYLFNPVRDLLRKRQSLVEQNIELSIRDKESAAALKMEYDGRLKSVDTEADLILGEARKKALQRELQIIEEAREEATRIVERANAEAELERKKAVDDMKKEMITVATMIAGKMISQQIDQKEQEALVHSALAEMGDEIWQS